MLTEGGSIIFDLVVIQPDLYENSLMFPSTFVFTISDCDNESNI